MANTNFPPQSNKVKRIKGFGEDVGQMSRCINVSHLNISILNVIPQEVVYPPKMSHFLWKTEFLATEVALVLSHMMETLLKITPKSLMVCTIHRIWEQQLIAATYSGSVVDCATEDCFQEDQQTREDLRKW
jgi:hypothetical protein